MFVTLFQFDTIGFYLFCRNTCELFAIYPRFLFICLSIHLSLLLKKITGHNNKGLGESCVPLFPWLRGHCLLSTGCANRDEPRTLTHYSLCRYRWTEDCTKENRCSSNAWNFELLGILPIQISGTSRIIHSPYVRAHKDFYMAPGWVNNGYW